MIEIDEISLLVTTDTDITMAQLEGRLNKEGYTLNYHGIPHNDFLLADVLNDRTPNLYGEAYGGIEDLCVQIRLARPDGTLWLNLLTPRSATGPSLKKLAIGSQENFGIPVQAVLRIFLAPAQTEGACIVFPGHRQKEFFLQALKKNRVALPLIEELPPRTAGKFVHPLPEDHPVLALALWGEVEVVEGETNLLQELAHSKKGAWFEIEEPKTKNYFLDILRDTAMRSWKEKSDSMTGKITQSHLSIMRRLQRIS